VSCPRCESEGTAPSIIEEMFKAVNPNIKIVNVTPTDPKCKQCNPGGDGGL